MTTSPSRLGTNWNYYRKIVNVLRKNGMHQPAKDIAALIRVAASVEKGDYAEAAHRLHTECPREYIRGDGCQGL
jgi:hypothetical protein